MLLGVRTKCFKMFLLGQEVIALSEQAYTCSTDALRNIVKVPFLIRGGPVISDVLLSLWSICCIDFAGCPHCLSLAKQAGRRDASLISIAFPLPPCFP